jgi:hypothetical protein
VKVVVNSESERESDAGTGCIVRAGTQDVMSSQLHLATADWTLKTLRDWQQQPGTLQV